MLVYDRNFIIIGVYVNNLYATVFLIKTRLFISINKSGSNSLINFIAYQ